MNSAGDSNKKYPMKEGLLLSSLQLLCNLGVDALSKLFHAHGSLLATTLLTHGNEALSTLLLTYDNHVRHTPIFSLRSSTKARTPCLSKYWRTF